MSQYNQQNAKVKFQGLFSWYELSTPKSKKREIERKKESRERTLEEAVNNKTNPSVKTIINSLTFKQHERREKERERRIKQQQERERERERVVCERVCLIARVRGVWANLDCLLSKNLKRWNLSQIVGVS